MSWIEEPLTRLEASLRAFIEGDPEVDGIPRKFHKQMFQSLVSAMQAGLVKIHRDGPGAGLVLTAPDQYILVLPSDQANILLSHTAELDHLAQKLARKATQMDIHLAAPPMLRVVGSPTAEHITVRSEFSHAGIDDSYTAILDDKLTVSDGAVVQAIPKAFLIVNGLATYPLVDTITNIGSSSDNQLILEYPAVSHRHAQLRVINNRFTIFDLDSRGGTLVNGIPVANQVLNPGDVILLAGIPLVYGHETPAHIGYTQEIPPSQPRPDVL